MDAPNMKSSRRIAELKSELFDTWDAYKADRISDSMFNSAGALHRSLVRFEPSSAPDDDYLAEFSEREDRRTLMRLVHETFSLIAVVAFVLVVLVVSAWTRTMNALWIAIIAATIGLTSVASGADKEPPAWKKPSPGTRAFLGDDGGGVNTATVCDTADRYRDWLNYEHPPGCQTFQHDLPVIIEVVLLDSVLDTKGTLWLPLVKVHIPSRNFIGYCQLLGLHPVIPSGTIIHFKRMGNETIHLFPEPTSGQGTDLGDAVLAKIITYDPSKDDSWELYVTVLDGEYAGKNGWMSALDASGEDGKPVDRFSQSVIENKPQ
jgi:hypothetical protein